MDAAPIAYPFQGVPLTPSIAQVIIRQVYRGRLVERQVLVDEVLREHVNRGGLRGTAQDIAKTVKVALAALREAGDAVNPSVGYWRINDTLTSDLCPAEVAAAPPPEPAADLEIGVGSETVYVYYLPVYRMVAEERGEASWPCKIGRTSGDPLSRVLSQASTALPERPHIALAIRSSNSSAWEGALHNVLALRGRCIDESPGSEWFLTSPAEIVDFVKKLSPELFDESQGVH
jgi:hypothetical protein